MRSDQDVVPAEMLDDLLGRMVDIHQHKIRLGVDRLERSGVVMISLVDHDLRCSRKLANKGLQIPPVSDGSGGIVRVANVNQAGRSTGMRKHVAEIMGENRVER